MAMPVYPLQSLLSVRLFREEGAKNEVRAAERRVEEAREAVRKEEEKLEAYRKWWPEEVDRRYAAILGKKMSTDDMGIFREGLNRLAADEQIYVQAVNEAVKAVKMREKEVTAAREAVVIARKEAAKIEAHRDIWMVDAKKEAERQEDLEMEEFKSPAGQADD